MNTFKMNKSKFFSNGSVYKLSIVGSPFLIILFLILKNNAIYFQTFLMAINVAICIRLILPFSKLKKYRLHLDQMVDFYIKGYTIKIYPQFLLSCIYIYMFMYVSTFEDTSWFQLRGITLDPFIEMVVKSYISFSFFYNLLSIDIRKEDKKPDKTRF
jgi:hypothetical protein